MSDEQQNKHTQEEEIDLLELALKYRKSTRLNSSH